MSSFLRDADEVASESTRMASENNLHFRRLVQTVRNRRGRFGLVFAVCNDPAQCRKLNEELAAVLRPVQNAVSLELRGDEPSLLDVLLAAPKAPEPLFVLGIERLLPSAPEIGGRQGERTLQELQMRREQFRRLGRPVLLWMPEYVYAIIGQRAVDFWSWQSGGFFFKSERSPDTVMVRTGELAGSSVESVDRRDVFYFSAGVPLPVTEDPFTSELYVREVQESARALRKGTRVVIISGRAGTGKTRLAQQLAIELQPDYPDGVVVLRLSSHPSADDVMKQILGYLRPEAAGPDPVSVAALYRLELERRRVLVIADDVAKDFTLKLLLPPSRSKSALVVTSRIELKLPGALSIALGPLSESDAVTLLRKLAPRIEPEIAKSICVLCGYLPSAIGLAGSLLAANPDMDPRALVTQLSKAGYSSEKREQKDALESIFNASISVLRPETRRALLRMSVFPGSFDGMAEVFVCQDTDQKQLQELVARGLVLPVNGTASRYSMHTATRSLSDSLLDAKEMRSTARRFATHYLTVVEETNRLYSDSLQSAKRAIELLELEWTNINAGQRWASEHSDKDDKAAELCTGYAINSRHLVRLLHLQPRERVVWLEAGLEAVRRLGDRQREETILLSLGDAFVEIGDTGSAIGFFEDALEISRTIGDRHGEAMATGYLGGAYMTKGELDRANTLHARHLMLAREIADQKEEGIALRNLGRLSSLKGEQEQALTFYMQALALVRELGNAEAETDTLVYLGDAYLSLTDPTRAIESYKKALSFANKLADLRTESTLLNHLGQAYSMLGQWERAKEFHEKSLTIIRQIGNRLNESIQLANLGHAYNALRDYKRAADSFEQQLAITREILDKASEVRALTNLGDVYLARGDSRRAVEFYEQAKAGNVQMGNRFSEMWILHRLGRAHAALGDHRRAIGLFDQQLAIARQISDREGEVIALINLGNAYLSSADPMHAFPVIQALAPYLEDQNANVRESASKGLRVLGTRLDSQGIQAIAAGLEDENPDVRKAAIELLIELQPRLDPRTIQAIAARLEDENPDVRKAAFTGTQRLSERLK